MARRREKRRRRIAKGNYKPIETDRTLAKQEREDWLRDRLPIVLQDTILIKSCADLFGCAESTVKKQLIALKDTMRQEGIDLYPRHLAKQTICQIFNDEKATHKDRIAAVRLAFDAQNSGIVKHEVEHTHKGIDFNQANTILEIYGLPTLTPEEYHAETGTQPNLKAKAEIEEE